MNGLPFLGPEDRPPCMESPDIFWEESFVADPEVARTSREATQRMAVGRVCVDCPFRPECAEYAITHEAYGWWAGLGPKDREDIRRRRGVHVDLPTSLGGLDWVPKERRRVDRVSRSRMTELNYREIRSATMGATNDVRYGRGEAS